MKAETLAYLPLEAARKAGHAVLWLTELAIPPNPSIETRAAQITTTI